MMKAAFTILMAITALPLFADVKVFLYPRFETEETSVRVEEIAWVEGDAEQADKTRKITISSNIYRDGFIDSRELTSILKSAGVETFSIIGNSVRVTKPKVSKADRSKLDELAEHAVRKGDIVTVVVKARKITLETHGKVMKDAVPGDEVTVDLDKKRSVKGCLKEDHRVEVRI
jgi:hypothetical protein